MLDDPPGLITRIADRLERLVLNICWILAALFIFTVFLDVFFRQVIQMPISWTIDLTMPLFVWSGFLGATVAQRRGMHFSVKLWSLKNQRVERVCAFVVELVVTAFVLYVIWHGARYALTGINKSSMMLGYPLALSYASLPVCFAIMLVFNLERLLGGSQEPES